MAEINRNLVRDIIGYSKTKEQALSRCMKGMAFWGLSTEAYQDLKENYIKVIDEMWDEVKGG